MFGSSIKSRIPASKKRSSKHPSYQLTKDLDIDGPKRYFEVLKRWDKYPSQRIREFKHFMKAARASVNEHEFLLTSAIREFPDLAEYTTSAFWKHLPASCVGYIANIHPTLIHDSVNVKEAINQPGCKRTAREWIITHPKILEHLSMDELPLRGKDWKNLVARKGFVKKHLPGNWEEIAEEQMVVDRLTTK